MTATRASLPDGRRHFQHGPIDLVIGCDGDAAAARDAHDAAWRRFREVLPELVVELAALQRAVRGACPLQGSIARRMWHACALHRARFITPMAAVAGAVADELIDAYRRPGIDRAWVNNGGDIALHLAAGASARIGVFADLARVARRGIAGPFDSPLDGRFEIASTMPVRGVATSGWRGRSFSLGIADSVTVLARTAADADAAATMIANAVDVRDARIVRRPASAMKDDSDLGDRLVTVDVPTLDAVVVRRALHAGLEHARTLRAAGTIAYAALVCQGRVVTTDAPASLATTDSAWRFAAPHLEAA